MAGGQVSDDEGAAAADPYLRKIVGSRMGGAMGCVMAVACAAVAAPGVYFLMEGVRTADPLGYLMAAFMLSGAVLLGPYAWFVHRTYFMGLRWDGYLELRSVVAFVPRWTTIDMRHVWDVRRLPRTEAYTLEFVDEQGRRLALFNAGVARQGELEGMLDEIAVRHLNADAEPRG